MARPRKSAEARRRRFQVYLSSTDLVALRERAAAANRPLRAFIREAALGRRLTVIPIAQNLSAWQELARLAANLNQVAYHANATGEVLLGGELAALRRAVDQVRADLMGVDTRDDGDDPENL